MKKKIALFLLALGMGTSMAYAAGPSYAYCKAKCAAEYKSCLASGTPKAECDDNRITCIPDCMLW
ncbi:hypothetical protein [Undibacterium flavidum]|uniref:Uncharacterized protein n=1 Tax=Undibacterium flavidum TaxID=2762297 RepID=A0ABR6YC54_9BURK|nr:hypothetical protein [Undibacterium flavidum]MBC3874130.1 hypothetical protein [Undibacterium flavidum]